MKSFKEFCNEEVSKETEKLFTKSNPTLEDFKRGFEISFGHNHYSWNDFIYDVYGSYDEEDVGTPKEITNIKNFIKPWFDNEDDAVDDIVDAINWDKNNKKEMEERAEMEANIRGFCHMVEMNREKFVNFIKEEIYKKEVKK